MIVACAAYLVAFVIFLLIYFGFYRPLFCQHFPGEINDLISVVPSIPLVELERWVSEEMSDLMVRKLTPKEQRKARNGRRKMIAERLIPVEMSATLVLAFTRQEVRSIRNRPPGPRSERDRLMESLFERSQHFCLMLTFAKATRLFMPWDTQRLIKFHREMVMNEVRDFLILFLKLSATYGELCRENLIAALDVWELAEESS